MPLRKRIYIADLEMLSCACKDDKQSGGFVEHTLEEPSHDDPEKVDSCGALVRKGPNVVDIRCP